MDDKTNSSSTTNTPPASGENPPSQQESSSAPSSEQSSPASQPSSEGQSSSEQAPQEQQPASSGQSSEPQTSSTATPSASASEAKTGSPASPPSSPAQHSGGRFIWIIILVILFLGFLFLAVWYFNTQLKKTAAVTPTTMQTATTALPKTLVVGTDPTFQPMEFTQQGKMVGYDIDLANLLAKQLGVKVQFKNIVFDNLFSALEQKQIDMIISAVTITQERQKKYDFSMPYLNAGQVIITQKTNSLIKSPKDLNGKKIGVQQGTTDEAEALKYTTNNLVIRFPDFVQATKALVDGKVDAIITDLPSAQGIVSSNPTLKISSDPFTNDYYGIVFRKGDPNIQKINSALNSLSVRGYLTDLKHKWLD